MQSEELKGRSAINQKNQKGEIQCNQKNQQGEVQCNLKLTKEPSEKEATN
jgi:hypothetical protein